MDISTFGHGESLSRRGSAGAIRAGPPASPPPMLGPNVHRAALASEVQEGGAARKIS
jgi:hypothetical protein